MNFHAMAIGIEHDMRNVLNVDRGGLGGIANADYIERNVRPAMAIVLSQYYNDNNKTCIDNFLDKYYYLDGDYDDVTDADFFEAYDEYRLILKSIT